MQDKAISVRVRLKYPDLDTFIVKFAHNFTASGVFIPLKALRPVGTRVRFEFLLGDGSRVFRGEGRIVSVRERGHPEGAGVSVEFTRLDSQSTQLLQRIMSGRRSPPSSDEQLSVSGPRGRPASDDFAREEAFTRPPFVPEETSKDGKDIRRPPSAPGPVSVEKLVGEHVHKPPPPEKLVGSRRSSGQQPVAGRRLRTSTEVEIVSDASHSSAEWETVDGKKKGKAKLSSELRALRGVSARNKQGSGEVELVPRESRTPSGEAAEDEEGAGSSEQRQTAAHKGIGFSLTKRKPPLPGPPPPEKVKDSPIIGIDLGTTNSCCSIVEGTRPRVLRSRHGYNTIPSVLAFDERGNLLIGHPAKSQMMLNPENTVYGSKRLLGRKFRSQVVDEIKSRFLYDIVEVDNGDAGVNVSSIHFSLKEVAAYILNELRELAEDSLERSVCRAVVSVPAYYNESQRTAVRKAGQMAGLQVERIVNEPTAAALAYGYGRNLDQKVLVYDLGGGTFDASVVQVQGDLYEVISTGGNTFLGGVDFDNRLIDYVVDQFMRKHGIDLRDDSVKMQRIKDGVEKVKCDLSEQPQAELVIPYIHMKDDRPLDIQMTFTKLLLNNLTGRLVEETIRVCNEVLKSASLQPQDIDELILVGGQSRMPLVYEKITHFFGKSPNRGIHPDEAVAVGTALLAQSYNKDDSVLLIDVLPMSIGIGLPGGRFKKVLENNTRLPAEKSYIISTTRDFQTTLEVVVFQGESDYVADNDYLGTLEFSGLKKAPRGRVSMEVTFKLSSECLLSITARDRSTGRESGMTMTTRDTPEAIREKLAMEADEGGKERPVGGIVGWLRKFFGRKGS